MGRLVLFLGGPDIFMCLVYVSLGSDQKGGQIFLDDSTFQVGPRGEVAFLYCFN